MLRNLFLTILLCFSFSLSFAQHSHNVGNNMDVYPYFFDGDYYLILSYKDSNARRLIPQSVVKFQMKDGSEMKLTGFDGSTKISSHSFYWGMGITTAASTERHFAIFPITLEQIEQFKKGVERVAVSTIPLVYKKKISKVFGNEFGQSLYKDYMNLKGDFNDELSNNSEVDDADVETPQN